ncbi:MAG TPA: response regulator [Candidatus Omnitrophota bacterium]|nr:response regulator [Candidatus Omnitrophota bacterium]
MAEQVLKDIKVLVVEDDESNQYLMELILGEFGFSFEIAANGQEAVEKVRKGKFDVVLMDLRMPVMDGYEATRVIRKELHNDLPIIAVTAHAMDWVEEECQGAGMNGYLTKPFDAEKLKSEILRFVKK